MKKRILIIALVVGASLVAFLASAGAQVISGNDNDQPITGDALQTASAAALAYFGEGTVTDTEVGDEESLYEVEVTLDDGTEVDVQLDEQFAVVGEEAETQPDAD